MRLLGGTSFFGMRTGARGHKARRSFQSQSNEREMEIPETGVSACESAPGELKRRTLQSGEGQRFSKMFNGRSGLIPVKGGIRKFTK